MDCNIIEDYNPNPELPAIKPRPISNESWNQEIINRLRAADIEQWLTIIKWASRVCALTGIYPPFLLLFPGLEALIIAGSYLKTEQIKYIKDLLVQEKTPDTTPNSNSAVESYRPYRYSIELNRQMSKEPEPPPDHTN